MYFPLLVGSLFKRQTDEFFASGEETVDQCLRRRDEGDLHFEVMLAAITENIAIA